MHFSPVGSKISNYESTRPERGVALVVYFHPLLRCTARGQGELHPKLGSQYQRKMIFKYSTDFVAKFVNCPASTNTWVVGERQIAIKSRREISVRHWEQKEALFPKSDNNWEWGALPTWGYNRLSGKCVLPCWRRWLAAAAATCAKFCSICLFTWHQRKEEFERTVGCRTVDGEDGKIYIILLLLSSSYFFPWAGIF